MLNWNCLIDEAALAAVLTDKYARFARPIREGLIVFLEGLAAAQQAEILAEQASLPMSAGISERLGVLARRCPVLHKLGQILSRDQQLAPELRRHLQPLESLPPATSPATIQDIVTKELGPLESRGIALSPPAIAEASVAVVIPFEQADRSAVGSRPGVLKVLKPGIEQRLELELELLERVGAHLDERCDALAIPHLDYADAFQQIREKLRHEVRLDEEQRHLAQAAACFADEPRVHVPALLEHCTPRVTAMERIRGAKVTDHTLDSRHDRRRLAELVVQALLAHPIFSRAGDALFHGDPHAGNLLLTEDDRLGVLDWSLVGSLGQRERAAIVQVILGATILDAERIVAILQGLDRGGRIDQPALAAIVEASLRRIRQGAIPGMSWLIGMLDEAVQRARLRVAPDLMMFRKSLHTLEGVVAEVGAGAVRIDDVITVDFVRHFAGEWPRRWLARPDSRDFATHLSNRDLAEAVMSYPSAVARYWIGQSLDLLDACSTNGTLQD